MLRMRKTIFSQDLHATSQKQITQRHFLLLINKVSFGFISHQNHDWGKHALLAGYVCRNQVCYKDLSHKQYTCVVIRMLTETKS